MVSRSATLPSPGPLTLQRGISVTASPLAGAWHSSMRSNSIWISFKRINLTSYLATSASHTSYPSHIQTRSPSTRTLSTASPKRTSRTYLNSPTGSNLPHNPHIYLSIMICQTRSIDTPIPSPVSNSPTSSPSTGVWQDRVRTVPGSPKTTSDLSRPYRFFRRLLPP